MPTIHLRDHQPDVGQRALLGTPPSPWPDHTIDTLRLPEALSHAEGSEAFESLWGIHPDHFHEVVFRGKRILTPRWQQSYGANYRYTGSVNNALPIPEALRPYLEWARAHVDGRLNGLLLNWYSPTEAHYIGKHRDDVRDLIQGSPIVTISLGGRRTFRMRPINRRGFADLPIAGGDVVVIPWETNRRWTHEVPHFARDEGRRISVTMRAYVDEALVHT